MIPMVQPPPSAESTNIGTDTTVAINDTIHKLHHLIFQISLPKTKTTKTATIVVETLLAACGLVTVACSSLLDNQESPMLSKVSSQLDVVTAHLAIPRAPP